MLIRQPADLFLARENVVGVDFGGHIAEVLIFECEYTMNLILEEKVGDRVQGGSLKKSEEFVRVFFPTIRVQQAAALMLSFHSAADGRLSKNADVPTR
jgi:hypothetical protein